MTEEQILQAVDIMHSGIVKAQEILLNVKMESVEMVPEG